MTRYVSRESRFKAHGTPGEPAPMTTMSYSFVSAISVIGSGFLKNDGISFISLTSPFYKKWNSTIWCYLSISIIVFIERSIHGHKIEIVLFLAFQHTCFLWNAGKRKILFCARKKTAESAVFIAGDPREIRTPDTLIRSQVLYPAELLGQIGRGRGTQTPNLRFWRPLLYQLRYAPVSQVFSTI